MQQSVSREASGHSHGWSRQRFSQRLDPCLNPLSRSATDLYLSFDRTFYGDHIQGVLFKSIRESPKVRQRQCAEILFLVQAIADNTPSRSVSLTKWNSLGCQIVCQLRRQEKSTLRGPGHGL